MGDVANGKTLFMRMCAMCHTYSAGAPHKVGPNLFGIFGKTCGTAPGFMYTSSMKTKGVKWDEKNLDEYLQYPRDFIPGTKMVFNGIKREKERKDLIAYLMTLK